MWLGYTPLSNVAQKRSHCPGGRRVDAFGSPFRTISATRIGVSGAARSARATPPVCQMSLLLGTVVLIGDIQMAVGIYVYVLGWQEFRTRVTRRSLNRAGSFPLRISPFRSRACYSCALALSLVGSWSHLLRAWAQLDQAPFSIFVMYMKRLGESEHGRETQRAREERARAQTPDAIRRYYSRVTKNLSSQLVFNISRG